MTAATTSARPVPHGTENGYVNYRCRCERCREGRRVAEERRRRAKGIKPKGWQQPPAEPRLSKDEAICCLSKRDALGRLPIGFCGPDCLRRGVTFEETNQ